MRSYEERHKIVSEIRKVVAEAVTGHTMGGAESEAAALALAVDGVMDGERQALERLERQDPIGMAIFGGDDRWLDSRISRTAAPK